MIVVVSAQGQDLEALTSPVFGRCPTFVFVDAETMAAKAWPNPAMSEGGGAGIQAAQFVMNEGAQAVLTGNLGPNAFELLQAANVPGYLVSEGTVRQAVTAFRAGQLQPMAAANVEAHAGMRGSRRTEPISEVRSRPQAAREAELAELQETLKTLRRQLAETMDKIEKLEREQEK
jgi:predicted Fe-Mo cluster-binding NifX family protein